MGAKSIRNYIGTLSALLGFAERKGWVTRNVAHRIELPAAETSEDIRFLESDEVLALADNATTVCTRRSTERSTWPPR